MSLKENGVSTKSLLKHYSPNSWVLAEPCLSITAWWFLAKT